MGNIWSSSNVSKTCAYVAFCSYKFNGQHKHILQRCKDEFLYVKDPLNRGISFKHEIEDEQLCEFLINEACNHFTTFFIASNFSQMAQVEYNEKNVDELRPLLLNLIKLMRNINNIEEYMVEVVVS